VPNLSYLAYVKIDNEHNEDYQDYI
jgi:hypothetical protein